MTTRRRFLQIACGTSTTMLLAACGANQVPTASTPAPKAADTPKPAAAPASPAASPMASPAASPMASPAASPMASPAASPMASPAAATTAPAVASSWRPNGSVEFVVPYAPGGGSSITALEMNRAIQENALLPQPFNITNKPGASGAVGLAYTVEKRGDPMVLCTGVDSALINNKIDGNSPIDFDDVTPVALTAVDEVLVATQASSQFQSMNDLIEFAKANPDRLTAGGTGASGTEPLVFALIGDAAGIRIEYVPFNSGGEVNAALLGGHIDVASSNPNEFFPQIEAGSLRPLATLSRQRLSMLQNTPTMVELGYPRAIMQLGRGVVAPPGIPADALAYYEDLIRRVTETQQWKEYTSKNAMTLDYRNSRDYTAYLTETRTRMRELSDILKQSSG